jgi:ribosomal protein S18 acetylase RimI-like enzyme
VTPEEAREAIRAFDRWRDEALSTSTERFDDPPAIAYVNERFPRYLDANFLEIETFDGAVTELLALVDRVSWAEGTPHRRIAVTDSATGEVLRPELEPHGFPGKSLLVMARLGHPDRDPVRADSRWVDAAAFEPAVRTALREEDPDEDPALLEEDLRFRLQLAEVLGARYCRTTVDGEPASICDLYVHEGVAQIEDVATMQAFRGRGLARATVSFSLAEAERQGARTTFLFTHVNNTPARSLYRSLGFVEVDRRWEFTSRRSQRPDPAL